MASIDQSDLVRRLAAGEAGALEEAYRLHGAQCAAVARRVLRDAALAQDAVQEAFLSLWRHREGLVVRSAGVGPWLVVVTRNAALGIARSAARRTARESIAAPPAVQDPIESWEARADAGELRDALMQLPQEQRTVIAMAYFGQRTLAEIAASTSVPLGTVKRRAQLALQKLARTLGESSR